MEPNANTISDRAKKYLRLHRAENIGPVVVRRLVEYFGDIDTVADASLADLERVEDVGEKRAKSILAARNNEEITAAVEHEITQAAERGVRIICPDDDEYPAGLKQIPDPPICLYVRGQIAPEDKLAIAIVGSRKCTQYGYEQATRFAELLAQAGFTVVSGMARGIDGRAHEAALRCKGRTIAVLGNGLSNIYPPEHDKLADRIEQRGAVISELPMDTPPDAKNFPPRNRIVIGLCLGVIVVEANKRSGALISARLATEYNREVFAIPGRIDSATSVGTNALIRDASAKLVTCLEDILDELGQVGELLSPKPNSRKSNAASPVLDEDEARLFEHITNDPRSIDDLYRASGFELAKLGSMLTMLQLKGAVTALPGQQYARRS
jgi:DNA processing protein